MFLKINRIPSVLFLTLVAVTSAQAAPAKKPAPFSFWVGKWQGEIKVYSATGDTLETIQAKIESTSSASHKSGIQNISLHHNSSFGYQENMGGYFIIDNRGPRRLLRSPDGNTSSDLRGKMIDQNKIFWFNIDVNGYLRESYTEIYEGDQIRVSGFRWDGERTASFRIIDALYKRVDSGRVESKQALNKS